MIEMIKRIFSYLIDNKWQYLLHGNHVRVFKTGLLKVGKACAISDSSIIVEKGSSLIIGNNVVIKNCNIYTIGKVTIGEYTIIKDGTYTIENGILIIGHHSKLTAKRFWIRFGGVVNIGNYTNINEGSEVRCDEKITIGNYNQISFNVNIWDTNTHNILPVKERREMAEKYYPYFGKEISRPVTAPIVIGNDCWLGQGATILKGSNLGDGVIVGYNCIIPGKTIPANATVVTDVTLKIKGND